ncbi:MAG: hypothetical protein EA384_16185 [Spirochaetaceae bacterium]|nr:MAG: hypothetical protein EA384_16185 [Spirochaetaceae bacterium]
MWGLEPGAGQREGGIDISTRLERYRSQKSSPPAGLHVPEGFGYIHYKAFLYLDIGPEAYREGDALRMPPPAWSAATLETLEHGCRQIFHWRGISDDSPLEGIGIPGFYQLIQLFHFRVASQVLLDTDVGFNLDRMRIRHIVDGKEFTLYNRVPEQTWIDF